MGDVWFLEAQLHEANKRFAADMAKFEAKVAAKAEEKARRERRISWSDWANERRQGRKKAEQEQRYQQRLFEFRMIENQVHCDFWANWPKSEPVPTFWQALKDWVWPQASPPPNPQP